LTWIVFDHDFSARRGKLLSAHHAHLPLTWSGKVLSPLDLWKHFYDKLDKIHAKKRTVIDRMRLAKWLELYKKLWGKAEWGLLGIG
jgi:hypothetical protein